MRPKTFHDVGFRQECLHLFLCHVWCDCCWKQQLLHCNRHASPRRFEHNTVRSTTDFVKQFDLLVGNFARLVLKRSQRHRWTLLRVFLRYFRWFQNHARRHNHWRGRLDNRHAWCHDRWRRTLRWRVCCFGWNVFRRRRVERLIACLWAVCLWENRW